MSTRTPVPSMSSWAMPYYAAEQIREALTLVRDQDPITGAIAIDALLRYLPRREQEPPRCGAKAPVSGPYACDLPSQHRESKHHATIGQYEPYEVLWGVA